MVVVRFSLTFLTVSKKRSSSFLRRGMTLTMWALADRSESKTPLTSSSSSMSRINRALLYEDVTFRSFSLAGKSAGT